MKSYELNGYLRVNAMVHCCVQFTPSDLLRPNFHTHIAQLYKQHGDPINSRMYTCVAKYENVCCTNGLVRTKKEPYGNF